MKIAITGGGNPYALNLARMAISYGHEVIGIGRSALRGEAFTLGVQKMGYRYHVYSVGPDTEFIIDLLAREKPDVIVNYAAQGEGQASFHPVKIWKHFYRTNTQHLVEFTEKLHGFDWLKKFIQIGTSELYGSCNEAVPETSPIRPSSPYAASKAAFDLHLLSVAKVCKFPALVIRPSNAYCPGQQLHRVIPKAFIYGLNDRKFPLHGGGVARKSYLFADDLSKAVLLLAQSGNVGEVYNCGADEPVSIKRILELVAQCLGKHPTELYDEVAGRVGEDSCYWLDSTKLKSLGWAPQINLLGGISWMHDWMRSHPELLSESTDYRLRA